MDSEQIIKRLMTEIPEEDITLTMLIKTAHTLDDGIKLQKFMVDNDMPIEHTKHHLLMLNTVAESLIMILYKYVTPREGKDKLFQILKVLEKVQEEFEDELPKPTLN